MEGRDEKKRVMKMVKRNSGDLGGHRPPTV